MFDLSPFLGYVPGSILLVNNQGSPSSMAVMIHPGATVQAAPGAGRVSQLRVDEDSPSTLRLEWGPSCSAADDDYAVFLGALGDFASHTVDSCTTGGATTATVSTPTVDAYFLIVPREGPVEGSYGVDSAGVERPVGITTCGAQSVDHEPPCP